MVEQFHVSERRACRLVGLSRDSYRHPPQETEMNQALSAKIIEIAHVRRRFGYRRIHDLLRPEFAGVNLRISAHRGRHFRLMVDGIST